MHFCCFPCFTAECLGREHYQIFGLEWLTLVATGPFADNPPRGPQNVNFFLFPLTSPFSPLFMLYFIQFSVIIVVYQYSFQQDTRPKTGAISLDRSLAMRKLALLLALIMGLSITVPLPAAATANTPPPAQAEEEKQPEQTTDAPAQPGAGTSPTYSVPFPIEEQAAYYMVELKTDTIIFAQNEHKKMYPASLTKIMTAILALENIPDLNTVITYPLEIQDIMYQANKAAGGQMSVAGFSAGEEITALDLLYGTMLPSGNEAAAILADYVAGSLPAFYDMMNAKAAELGAVNTHFSSAHGLFDPENYTTAYDMYLITKYAMANETFAQIVSTPTYVSNPTNKNPNGYAWSNSNQMINPRVENYYYPEITGVKTGTLDESGRCLITTAQKSGYEYMLVLMGTTLYDSTGAYLSPRSDFVQTASFYDWAFENYKVKTIIEKGTVVYDVNLRLARDNKKRMQLMSGETFSTLMPKNYNVDNVRTIPQLDSALLNEDGSINAPVTKGDVVGELRLILSGKEIGRVPLLAAENAERSEALYLLNQIRGFFTSFWFKFIFIFLLVFAVLYIILVAVRNRNKRKYRHVRHRRKL